MKEKTLLERLLEAGYPKEDVFHHESDLYVYVTPLTTRIIEEWCKKRGYNRSWHCPQFKDQVTGRAMYDCAFNYYDIEAEKERERRQEEFDNVYKEQIKYVQLCGGFGRIQEADDTYNGLNLKCLEAFNKLHDGCVFIGKVERGAKEPGLKKYGLPVYNFSCDFAVPCYDGELDSMLKNYSDGYPSVSYKEISDRVDKLHGYPIIWF